MSPRSVAAMLGAVLGLMEVAVADVVVVGFVRAVMAVAVAVVVDEQRMPGDLEQSAAEGLGEVLGPQYLGGGTVRDHAPTEQHHPIRSLRLLEVVGREDHRRSSFDLGIDDPQDGFLARQVQTGDRLVEQQQTRRSDEGLRDQHTLALPARQLPERAVDEIGHFQPLCDVVHFVAVGSRDATQQPTVPITPHPQDLVDGKRHPVVMSVLLRHECGRDPVSAGDDSGGRSEQIGQEEQQCALAAAVRADERDRSTGGERRRGPIERNDIAVPDGDGVQADDVLIHPGTFHAPNVSEVE